ncbi:DUF262 domain-containing protein [Streptomyces sp. E11-3]|uniref:GmrSD restriction endonuclease domain-containing protein n=1 Tax=Streptomyces sp. E11-3 TaxID=3110112 RepID=UPI00397F8972
MQISTVLDKVDSGELALPEFQRGYVWTRDQVRGFFQSLYRGYPIGGFLTWSTKAQTAATRGGSSDKDGTIQLLLDGQQRVTTLYGVLRGRPPRFFEGHEGTLTGLFFNMQDQTFEFYAPVKMRDNPAWVDVSDFMQRGLSSSVAAIQQLTDGDQTAFSLYVERLSRLEQIRNRTVHIEDVTGEDKTIDVVVEIFNRVNSGGTKLSKGDLALAAICAQSPDARAQMNEALDSWQQVGFHFKLDWLLRNVNAVVAGEALFTKLRAVPPEDFRTGLSATVRTVSGLLDVVGGRLGLDYDRVLAGRGAFPVLSRILHQHGGTFPDAAYRDRALYWYVHSFLRGRYASSTETALNQDLSAYDSGGVDALIEQLSLSHGELAVRPGDFVGQTVGARVYPLLYLLTRVGEAKDFGSGIPLRANLLGHNSSLEVHHIFPKARLSEADYPRSEINAVANFCFLTKDTNLKVGARLPEEYLADIEDRHPGTLASQWIPLDRDLWRMDRYRDFLAARRELLAQAANTFLTSLRDGTSPQEGSTPTPRSGLSPLPLPLPLPPTRRPAPIPSPAPAVDAQPGVEELATWLGQVGMSTPEYDAEVPNPRDGHVMTVAAAFWPNGLQEEAGSPVVLSPDPDDTDEAALEAAGFQIFHSPGALRAYVERLREQQAGERAMADSGQPR